MGEFADDLDEPSFWRRAPGRRLTGLVSGLYGYDERGRGMSGVIEAASLTVPLIISFSGHFHIALGREPTPGDRFACFAAGLFAGPVVMNSDGASQCIQVNFTPLGGRLFFALPMSELADRMVPLDDIGDRALVRLSNALGELNSWESRLDLVEAFVEKRLCRAAALDPAVIWAFDVLAATGGQAKVGQIAQRLDWSRRKLVARFRNELGLPPKTIARIVRFEAASKLAAAAAKPDWADIAAACGFADQSHLVREFAVLAGASPVAWRGAA